MHRHRITKGHGAFNRQTRRASIPKEPTGGLRLHLWLPVHVREDLDRRPARSAAPETRHRKHNQNKESENAVIAGERSSAPVLSGGRRAWPAFAVQRTTAAMFDVAYWITRAPGWATASFYLIGAGVVGGRAAAVFGLIDFAAIPKRTRARRIDVQDPAARQRSGIAGAGMRLISVRQCLELPGPAA